MKLPLKAHDARTILDTTASCSVFVHRCHVIVMSVERIIFDLYLELFLVQIEIFDGIRLIHSFEIGVQFFIQQIFPQGRMQFL